MEAALDRYCPSRTFGPCSYVFTNMSSVAHYRHTHSVNIVGELKASLCWILIKKKKLNSIKCHSKKDRNLIWKLHWINCYYKYNANWKLHAALFLKFLHCYSVTVEWIKQPLTEQLLSPTLSASSSNTFGPIWNWPFFLNFPLKMTLNGELSQALASFHFPFSHAQQAPQSKSNKRAGTVVF